MDAVCATEGSRWSRHADRPADTRAVRRPRTGRRLDAASRMTTLARGAARAETSGAARGVKEPTRVRPGHPGALRREEGIRGDRQNAMMVKASPAASLVVIQT